MKVTVQSIGRFAEGTFLLKAKPEKNLRYKAGQFVMIKAFGVERPFSISSAKGEKTIEFLISPHPDGALTPKLAKLKKGDTFEITGPFGMFTDKDTKAKEIFFIAAGTGIAPFRAMISDALKRFPEKKITLIFGFRYNFYFEKIWRELERKNKNFKVFVCCSKPKKNWKGLKGRVTEHLENLLKNSKDKEIYICGPPPMVQTTLEVLEKKLKFGRKQIHMEKW